MEREKQWKEYVKASQKLSALEFHMVYGGLEINVYWFRIMHRTGEWMIKKHCHSSYEFHVVKSGSCKVREYKKEQEKEYEKEYVVKQGQIYITPPQVFHEQASREGEEYVEYCLNCDIRPASDGMKEEQKAIYEVYRGMPFCILPDGTYEERMCEESFEEILAMKLGYYSAIEHRIFLMLGDMAAVFSGKNVPEYEVEKKEDFEAARFEKIRQYVQDNLEAGIRVEDIAHFLFLSTKQTGRIIKSRTGMSAREYILSQKHERAKEYLKEDAETVSSIADRLGFSSVQHFNTFFKQREGYSPVVFRKSCGSKHVR